VAATMKAAKPTRTTATQSSKDQAQRKSGGPVSHRSQRSQRASQPGAKGKAKKRVSLGAAVTSHMLTEEEAEQCASVEDAGIISVVEAGLPLPAHHSAAALEDEHDSVPRPPVAPIDESKASLLARLKAAVNAIRFANSINMPAQPATSSQPTSVEKSGSFRRVTGAAATTIQKLHRGHAVRESLERDPSADPWKRAGGAVDLDTKAKYITLGDRFRIVRQKSSVSRTIISAFQERKAEADAHKEGGGLTEEAIEEVLAAGQEQLANMLADAAVTAEERAAQKAEEDLAAAVAAVNPGRQDGRALGPVGPRFLLRL
jgi:hypothetical protein